MLKLAAFSALHARAIDPPVDYRQVLTEASGHPVRRLSRFTALALTGVTRLRKNVASMRSDCAVYFCSEQANIADMSRVVHGITIERRPPTPLEFLAVSSNLTGFHVAKQFGLQGPNLTLCRSDASFESGLELAMLTQPQFGGALVSYVEDSGVPLERHRIRVDWPAGGDMAECSHWLYFDRDCARPLAIIESCERYASLAVACDALALHSRAGAAYLSFGLRIGAAEAADCLAAFGVEGKQFHFIDAPVFSKGLTAYALCRFIECGLRGQLLNVNRTASGEVYLVSMRVD